MSSTRRTVFVGALAGGVAIHMALIACGSMTGSRDGGGDDVVALDAARTDNGFTFDGLTLDNVTLDHALDTLAEAARDVTAAEMGTAEAGGMDGGTPTCTCPPPPARPTRSFTLSFDRGRGVERPRGDYSEFTFDIVPDFANGDPYINVAGIMVWWLPDNRRVTLTCGIQLTPDGRSVIGGPPLQCSLGITSSSGSSSSGRVMLPSSAITLTTFTNTAAEIRIAPFSIVLDAGAGTWMFSGLVLRRTDPNGSFVTPPNFVAP